MKLYKNVTCSMVGTNKKEIQISEVSKLIQGRHQNIVQVDFFRKL